MRYSGLISRLQKTKVRRHTQVRQIVPVKPVSSRSCDSLQGKATTFDGASGTRRAEKVHRASFLQPLGNLHRLSE